MTPTQARYLAFIHKYAEQHRIAPSEMDIARAMRVTPPSVNRMMKSLEEMGFILRSPGVARSIRILLPPELIPKLKLDGEIEISEATMSLPKSSPKLPVPLYTFEASLYDGPFEEQFRKRRCIRRIEIRADQTLSEFHAGLFEAFGMQHDAEYEFNIGGNSRFATEAKHFGVPEFHDKRKEHLGRPEAYDGDGRTMQIGALDLQIDQVIGYCFGFQQDWYYFLRLTKIDKVVKTFQYPRITRKQGKAPPHYSQGRREQ